MRYKCINARFIETVIGTSSRVLYICKYHNFTDLEADIENLIYMNIYNNHKFINLSKNTPQRGSDPHTHAPGDYINLYILVFFALVAQSIYLLILLKRIFPKNLYCIDRVCQTSNRVVKRNIAYFHSKFLEHIL